MPDPEAEGGLTPVDLSVELAGLRLKNPVLLASGTAGYGAELSGLIDVSALGGIVLKSVTVGPRRGNPWPRIWETTAGMLNSIGLENPGIDAFLSDVLPSLEGLRVPLIASIAGETAREYAHLASRLNGAPIDALEVNVSCPNVEKGGIQFGIDPHATSAVVYSIRENTSLPIFVKLSAAMTDITQVAESAAAAGASGLSLINTLPGMAVDPESRRPRLASITGGLSGPAIKPVALKAVWDCYNATDLPIIGSGGIFDTGDALEFIVAGASAVALGTAVFLDPERPLRVIEELPSALAGLGVAAPGELVGTLETQ